MAEEPELETLQTAVEGVWTDAEEVVAVDGNVADEVTVDAAVDVAEDLALVDVDVDADADVDVAVAEAVSTWVVEAAGKDGRRPSRRILA